MLHMLRFVGVINRNFWKGVSRTEKERLRKTALMAVMLCLFLLSAYVYLNSAACYLAGPETDYFEFIAYLVGYFLTEICLAAAIYELAAGRSHIASLWAAFVCMVLRFVFDIATVLADGYALVGLFQMDVFIVLDLLILAGIIVVIYKGGKIAKVLLAALTLVYLFGEAASYPMKTFDDVDEFVLMLSIFAVVVIPLFPMPKPDSGRPKP